MAGKPNLTPAETNHLRRLLAWVRCDLGPSPDELVATVRQIAPAIGPINDQQKERLIEDYQRAKAIPKYVRSAVKALEKLLVKQEGVVVDVEPGAPSAESCSLPGVLGSCSTALPPPPAALPAPALWLDEPPTEPGFYRFRCMENGDRPELVQVADDPRGGSGLCVICPHLGTTDVQVYHDGLTDPRWQRVGSESR